MKLIVSGDIHAGTTDIYTIKAMVDDMLKENPDIIILAGDIGESLDDFNECLQLFKDSKGVKGLVIGNHDLWNQKDEIPSIDKWEKLLPSSADKNDFVWMEDEIIYHENIAIVGTTAWYDYSNVAPAFAQSEEYLFKGKGRYNNDANFIDWNKTDIEFARECQKGLVEKLEFLETCVHINKVIVITHVPIFSEQMVRSVGDNPIGDAYFGNLTMGKAVMGFSKVKHVISGHTHRCRYREIGDMQLTSLPGDYMRPAYITEEI